MRVLLLLLPYFTANVFANTGEQSKLLPAGLEAGDIFGQRIAVSGNTAVISAQGDDDRGADSGAVYIFAHEDGVWVEQAKLIPADVVAGDEFGAFVAIDGDVAVASSTDHAGRLGAAWVFRRTGGIWFEEAKLTGSAIEARDRFGHSLAIDGDTIIVGANSAAVGGVAYVFAYSGAGWTEEAKLEPSDVRSLDQFGHAVALANDTLFVSARGDDDLGSNSGSVFIFTREGAGWSESAQLLATDGQASDQFGYALALSTDTLVVGAFGLGVEDRGAAYVFERTEHGWVEETKLVASDSRFRTYFGTLLSIDGDLIAVGAGVAIPGELPGGAFVYIRTDGPWAEQPRLFPSDGQPGDRFGVGVAVSGELVLVASDFHDAGGVDSGAVYHYEGFQEGDMAIGDLDANGQEELIVDFGHPYGIYMRLNNSVWAPLHHVSAEIIRVGDLNNEGTDDVIVDFGGPYGMYTWMDNSGWVQMHHVTPELIVAADLDGNGLDDVVVDFGNPFGIYTWFNDSVWIQMHHATPRAMEAADIDGNGQAEVLIDFGPPHGIWVWRNNSEWFQLNGFSAETITTGDVDGNGQADVIIDFGRIHGLWLWRNGFGWLKLNDVSPGGIAIGDLDGNGKAEVIVDFQSPHGIWIWMNGAGWVPRISLPAESIQVGDLDGDGRGDVVFDFGIAHGLWVWKNNTTWVSLHNISP